MADERISDQELDELEALAANASPAPWKAFGGPGIGGPDFIALGGDHDNLPDMYVMHDNDPAPLRDLDFIAAARNIVPQLIAELRSRRAADRSLLIGSTGGR